NTGGEDSAGTCAIERVRRAQPLPAEFAGDVHADAAGAERGRRRGPLAGDRGVVAPGAEVEEVRRVIFVEANRELVVQRDIHLAVDFEEAGVALGDIAVQREEAVRYALGFGARNARAGESVGIEALSAGIDVAPGAEVEGEHAE